MASAGFRIEVVPVIDVDSVDLASLPLQAVVRDVDPVVVGVGPVVGQEQCRELLLPFFQVRRIPYLVPRMWRTSQ